MTRDKRDSHSGDAYGLRDNGSSESCAGGMRHHGGRELEAGAGKRGSLMLRRWCLFMLLRWSRCIA